MCPLIHQHTFPSLHSFPFFLLLLQEPAFLASAETLGLRRVDLLGQLERPTRERVHGQMDDNPQPQGNVYRFPMVV